LEYQKEEDECEKSYHVSGQVKCVM